MTVSIADYALIGDCETAALVSRGGSIDWLCLPRFDSGACFAALLGTPENGRWRIAPTAPVSRVRRKYLGDTLVLETEFETDAGVIAVTDFMPIRDKVPDIVRFVECRKGRVPVRMDLTLRFDYGSVVPWVQRHDGGIVAIAGPDAVMLHSTVPTHGENLTTVAEFTLGQGERAHFTLGWHRSFEPFPSPIDPDAALTETLAWWQEWSSHCRYAGYRKDLILRSLITMKALTFAPSGGIVAAPTTSLPEQL